MALRRIKRKKLRPAWSAGAKRNASWWDNLSLMQKQEYIKKHPNSKFAKRSNLNKPPRKPKEKLKPKANNHDDWLPKIGQEGLLKG